MYFSEVKCIDGLIESHSATLPRKPLGCQVTLANGCQKMKMEKMS